MCIANTSDAVWELNMSYLWLAQRLLQEDRARGMFRLGLTADMAAALRWVSSAGACRQARTCMRDRSAGRSHDAE